jgi:hypothetical protein
MLSVANAPVSDVRPSLLFNAESNKNNVKYSVRYLLLFLQTNFLFCLLCFQEFEKEPSHYNARPTAEKETRGKTQERGKEIKIKDSRNCELPSNS